MNFLTTAALLDSVVLASLSKEDMYGYTLTKAITKVLEVSESSLYPALRRLQKDGHLEAYDQPDNGRNRRYYRITENGKKKLKEYQLAWKNAKGNIDGILLGGAK